ncbi:hypothetical protein C8Q74DRAFT_257333 [Fomes fomentarius]|nr:hypothetical protein C8Q74DRAFT_257333 [Fomes fomentarius]
MTRSPITPTRKDVVVHENVSQQPLREGGRVCLATRASIEAIIHYHAPATIRERIKSRAVLNFRHWHHYLFSLSTARRKEPAERYEPYGKTTLHAVLRCPLGAAGPQGKVC